MSEPTNTSKQDSKIRPETRKLFEGVGVEVPDFFLLDWQQRADQYQQEYEDDLIKMFKLKKDDSSKAAS